MSFYNIDFTNRLTELIPPDKREPVHIAWWKQIGKQLEWGRKDVFVDYKEGSDYPVWVAANYSKGDRVKYGQSVYESLTDDNTEVPTNEAAWRMYELFFIGTDERIKYNGQRLVLEYALNKRFGTNFRQPPLQSDIYFEVYPPVADVFIIGGDENNSSTIFLNRSSEFIINDYSFGDFVNFAIYIPVAVWTDLSADAGARDKIISNFVNNYLPAGIKYEIITY